MSCTDHIVQVCNLNTLICALVTRVRVFHILHLFHVTMDPLYFHRAICIFLHNYLTISFSVFIDLCLSSSKDSRFHAGHTSFSFYAVSRYPTWGLTHRRAQSIFNKWRNEKHANKNLLFIIVHFLTKFH